MRTDFQAAPTRLSDYTPPSFEVESVYLDFSLDPQKTILTSKIKYRRVSEGYLELDGEDIHLLSVMVDGTELKRSEYKLTQTKLILSNVPDACEIVITTSFNPSENTKLMGLYVSGGRFCTQCEAQGFRRMTYFLDRPDALSVFTVRIEADKDDYPHLLSNGNMIEEGDAQDGRHFAVWHDPFRKPCYLFALVGGDFDILEDSFATMSGRQIPLTIYVDHGDAPRAEYAMDALKRSMAWDEKAFGREYDLDRFMIVAVRDFNFGAMENKGLNIFNSSLLLADAETATDLNFERIESVVAHEYFHNWTGNRITCRDWFQLCLKEGFTVYRDQEFSAHERDATVQRIKDVRALRSRQFPEDAGPLAHPVRPAEYLKIDNFYTATVYEKGAELIRMLKTLLGDEVFRKGCDHYFKTLDGTAATVEQFITCFEEASGENLSQFMRWYEQAGTPRLNMKVSRKDGKFQVDLKQSINATPGQAHKHPQVLPLKWQVITDNGTTSSQNMTVIQTDKAHIPNVSDYPGDVTVSMLQDFSAPVILDANYTADDLMRMMRYDDNGFNRWEAGQTLARALLCKMARSLKSGRKPKPDPALKFYVSALKETLHNENFSPAYKALVLTMPAEAEILQELSEADPVAVHLSVGWLERAIADFLREDLLRFYSKMDDPGDFQANAEAAGRRALKNRCLALLGARQDPRAAPLAMEQFKSATNMTNELAGLVVLTRLGGRRIEQSMQDFYDKWQNNPLVIDKWFMVSASRDVSNPVKLMSSLLEHDAYNPANPNRVRSLLGGFAMNNPAGFHHASGAGYQLFAEQVMDQDARNPQVAARLVGIFEIWRRLDKQRQDQIKYELNRIIASKPSANVSEIAQKTLGKNG